MAVFTIPEWAKKRITKATWVFFWSGRRNLVARRTVCLPKGQGGFGVIDFDLKAKAFAIQWIKRYFAPTPAKWKPFFSFFCMSCLSITPVEVFSTSTFPRNLIALLPQFYQHIVRAWSQFAGGAVAGILSLDVNSTTPRPLVELNSHSTYVIGRRLITPQPHCIGKFLPRYGPLHWSKTWDQIHLQSLDRASLDRASLVIYTALSSFCEQGSPSLVVLPESVRRLLVLASLVFSLPFRERGSPSLVVLPGSVRARVASF